MLDLEVILRRTDGENGTYENVVELFATTINECGFSSSSSMTEYKGGGGMLVPLSAR